MLENELISSIEPAGACTYDHDRLLLCSGQLEVIITSNEGHLLLALIEGITEKEALISRVWGDRGLVVSDSSYYKAIHTLRHYFSEVGLGRDALKTLPRRGVVLLIEIQIRKRLDNTSTHAMLDNIEPEKKNIETSNTPLPTTPSLLESSQNFVPSHLSTGPSTITTTNLNKLKGEWSLKFIYSLLAFFGVAAPLYYFYIILSKPQPLEDWHILWQSPHAKLYVEYGDNTNKDKITSLAREFGPYNVISETNFYIRKPISELLISCDKLQSHGEALCKNYLLINRKK